MREMCLIMRLDVTTFRQRQGAFHCANLKSRGPAGLAAAAPCVLILPHWQTQTCGFASAAKRQMQSCQVGALEASVLQFQKLMYLLRHMVCTSFVNTKGRARQ